MTSMIDLKILWQKIVISSSFRSTPIQGAFVLLICAATAAVYWPGLYGDFALDDFTNIVNNQALVVDNLSWAELSRAAFSFQAGPLMRPISMFTFALNRYFFGPDAYSFKLTNLLVHLLNGLLVFIFLRQLLAAYARRCAPQLQQHHLQWMGLLVGGLWLLHPLNFLPVLYVVQRETSLSALFVLLGVNLYVWARGQQLSGKQAGVYIWIGVPIATLLAMLCKESGVLLPVYALVLELFVFGFLDQHRNFDKPTAAFYFVFLMLPGCIGLLLLFTPRGSGFLSYGSRDFTMLERLMSEARVIWSYIRWTLLPDGSDFGLYHDDIAISRGLLQPATTLLSIVGVAGLLGVCWICRRRRPLLALGISWFLCGQLLESSIFPLELAYEHRNYLPDLGLLLALAALIRPEEAAAPRIQRFKYALLAVLLPLFAWITLQRAWHWSDNLTFARYEALHHPKSAYATYMLGQTYANVVLFGDHGSYDDAVSSLNAAAEVPDSGVIADVSLILVESQINNSVDPGVFPRIVRKVSTQRISASDLQGLEALVDCVDKNNCHLNPQDMHAVFRGALSNPHLGYSASAKANILVIYGNFLSAQEPDNLNLAREMMAQAATLVPLEPQYRANLVTMDIAMKNPELAREDLDALRRLNYLGHLDAEIRNFTETINTLQTNPRP